MRGGGNTFVVSLGSVLLWIFLKEKQSFGMPLSWFIESVSVCLVLSKSCVFPVFSGIVLFMSDCSYVRCGWTWLFGGECVQIGYLYM